MTLLRVIFGYMLVVHLALPTLLYVLYATPDQALAAEALVAQDPAALPFYAAAGVALVAAIFVPRFLLQKSSSGSSVIRVRGLSAEHPLSKVMVPYLMRLTFLEMVTIVGFVLGFLRTSAAITVPFAAVGLIGALLSAPTASLLARWRETA